MILILNFQVGSLLGCWMMAFLLIIIMRDQRQLIGGRLVIMDHLFWVVFFGSRTWNVPKFVRQSHVTLKVALATLDHLVTTLLLIRLLFVDDVRVWRLTSCYQTVRVHHHWLWLAHGRSTIFLVLKMSKFIAFFWRLRTLIKHLVAYQRSKLHHLTLPTTCLAIALQIFARPRQLNLSLH